MNNLILFNQYQSLNEGISPVLYHFTYPEYTLHMLSENRIHCSSTLGSSSDRNGFKGNYFYFSMQTSKNSRNGYGGAIRGYKGDGTIGNGRSVCWVLDGVKLQQQHSGKPLDYWAKLRNHHKADNDEMEERVIVNKPYIDNAHKYIKEIHIALDKSGKYDERMVELCAERNIPVYYYINAIAFENQRKEKAIDLSSLESFRSKDENDDPNDEFKNRDLGTIFAVLMYKDEANREKILKRYADGDGAFPKYVQERIDYYQRVYFNNSYNLDECGVLVETALQNSRTNTTAVFRFAVNLLTMEIRKMGVLNITEYLYRKSGKKSAPVSKPTEKPQEGLYYDGYLRSWSDRAWKYLDFYEVSDLLPEAESDYAFSNKLKDDNVSILTVYNFLVKKIGKGKTHQFFKKNDLEIIKGTRW